MLPAGTVLWRIHGDGHGAAAFRDTGAEIKRVDPRMHGNEGRFDCQAGEYGYLYAARPRHRRSRRHSSAGQWFAMRLLGSSVGPGSPSVSSPASD